VATADTVNALLCRCGKS